MLIHVPAIFFHQTNLGGTHEPAGVHEPTVLSRLERTVVARLGALRGAPSGSGTLGARDAEAGLINIRERVVDTVHSMLQFVLNILHRVTVCRPYRLVRPCDNVDL